MFLFPIHFGSGEEDPMHTLRWYGSVYNTDSRIHEEPAACVANAADCAVAAAAPAPTPLFTWPSQFCEWQVQVFITSK